MRALIRKRHLVVICAVLIAGSGLLYYTLNYRTYESTDADYDNYVPPYSAANFVVFGDMQGGSDWTPISPSFSVVVDVVSRTNAPMAFILGDLYFDSTDNEHQIERAETFLSEVANLNMPWYPVMGNHEAEHGGWAVAQDRIFEGRNTYYSFDTELAHFIVLDAYMPDAWGTISEEQLIWLEENLRATAKSHIFVFLHPPLYPVGHNYGSSLDTDPALRDRVANLFVQHGVDIVFCGHEHFYTSFGYQGLMQITSGGAGAILHDCGYAFHELEEALDETDQEPNDKEALHELQEAYKEIEDDYGYTSNEITRFNSAKELHYVLVELSANTIDISAYNLEGELIDQFTMES